MTLPEIDPFVDGAAVRRAGDVTYSAVAGLGALVASHVAPGGFTLTHVDEGAVCTAMLELYQNEGVIAEPAGALSVAALDNLDIAPGSTVVCLISGGNNDVSRYGEILERSLVHLGLKHYFLVDFPQEPGALRRFLDQVLGPDDDITLFEYVKRNNREFGPALVGIELGSQDGLTPLLERMDRSRDPMRAARTGLAHLQLPHLIAHSASSNTTNECPGTSVALAVASEVTGSHHSTGVPPTGTVAGSAARLHATRRSPRCNTIQRCSSS